MRTGRGKNRLHSTRGRIQGAELRGQERPRGRLSRRRSRRRWGGKEGPATRTECSGSWAWGAPVAPQAEWRCSEKTGGRQAGAPSVHAPARGEHSARVLPSLCPQGASVGGGEGGAGPESHGKSWKGKNKEKAHRSRVASWHRRQGSDSDASSPCYRRRRHSACNQRPGQLRGDPASS